MTSVLISQICLESWPTPAIGNVYFVVANLLLCYVLPLLVIAVCYMCIWKKVSCRKVPGEPMHNGANLVQRSKMKVITMILYVVVLFALSWLPLYVAFSLIKLCTLSPAVEKFTIAALPVAQWLGAANSSINPLLYAIFNHRFREGYKALLSGKICQALDYSNSMKYFGSKAGTMALMRNKNRAGKKPEMRKTIGAIYVHMDRKKTGTGPNGRDAAAATADRSALVVPSGGAKHRSLSMKETHGADEFADSMVQFRTKNYANSFV